MKTCCMAAVRSSSLSLIAALGLALLGFAACSADATIDAAVPVVPATQADQAEQAVEAPATEAPATDAPATADLATEAPATEAPASTGGSIEIVFDDGRTWSLETVDCYTEPDSAFGVFFMTGSNADGAELNVVESWPLDGDQSGGTAFIATFVDEGGAFFTAEGGPVSEAGGSLSFESRIYEGLALEPTLNGTFSCTA